ncbi:MAG: hypothetical protein RB191_18665 [Terriglobia bacterium]|nr:hypothetical protein [Terriglobia bacterium]
MAIGSGNPYPAIQQVTNLVRSQVQDDMMGLTGTIGEGQIFIDNAAVSVTMMNFFGAALRTMCRKMRTAIAPVLIFDNVVILGIPPLVSPTQGSAAPDPSIQVSLGYLGYFNGLTYNSSFLLPVNCLMVERLWERVNGSNDDFRPMNQQPQGLPSRYQDVYNLYWEWRQDSIWMPGSIETMDLRMRYQGSIPTLWTTGVDVSQTYIPIQDCVETLAGFIIQLIGMRQGAKVLPATMEWANDQVNDFLNEQIKRDQGMPYPVYPFGGDDSGGYSGLT